jgi:hypothetical protein
VVVDSLAATLVDVVTLTPAITCTRQPSNCKGVLLLFSIVRVQAPIAREQEISLADSSPDNGCTDGKDAGIVTFDVVVADGKEWFAKTPRASAPTRAIVTAIPICFLYSDNLFLASEVHGSKIYNYALEGIPRFVLTFSVNRKPRRAESLPLCQTSTPRKVLTSTMPH